MHSPKEQKSKGGRPPIVSDEDLLRIIAEFGEIPQYKLREKTKLKKSTLSMRLKRLREEGKIHLHPNKRGRTILSMVSLTDETYNFQNSELSELMYFAARINKLIKENGGQKERVLALVRIVKDDRSSQTLNPFYSSFPLLIKKQWHHLIHLAMFVRMGIVNIFIWDQVLGLIITFPAANR